MTSTTPYMVRAIHEWCSDQGFTPYMLVDATVEGVVVPMSLVTDGTIVMNLDHSAVHHLEMGNEWVLFSARFNGSAQDINIPIEAVRAIYAKENGQGCLFPETDATSLQSVSFNPTSSETQNASVLKKSKAKLNTAPKKTEGARTLQSVTKSKPPKKKKGSSKPSLKLVD